MSTRQITVIVDDLTGSQLDPADHSRVRFELDGKSYAIDLGKENAATFRAALQPYIDAATRVRGTRQDGAASAEERRRARQWASANGYQVAPRGKISREVMSAFRAIQ